MIGVFESPEQPIPALVKLGFIYKGEGSIPMRFYLSRTEGVSVNLHLYEQNHPEIELNLSFRDYLRVHPQARREYADLKTSLLQQSSSYGKRNFLLTGYNVGKDAFIKKVLKAARFNRIRMVQCTHYVEWDAATRMRQCYFPESLSSRDPYRSTFDSKEHAHLILYQGVEVIGYAHIQFWQGQRAALRMIRTDPPYRHLGFGCQFLSLCERWLQKLRVRSLHVEAAVSSIEFYRKNGCAEISFDDPSGAPPGAGSLAMGKTL